MRTGNRGTKTERAANRRKAPTPLFKNGQRVWYDYENRFVHINAKPEWWHGAEWHYRTKEYGREEWLSEHRLCSETMHVLNELEIDGVHMIQDLFKKIKKLVN